jgi:hypothetical protein
MGSLSAWADNLAVEGREYRVQQQLVQHLWSVLRAANIDAEESFDWSVEEQVPPRFSSQEYRVVLRLSHRDGRSHDWTVTFTDRLLMLLGGEPVIADEVLSAAAALVWRFYRPRFRISTRRRTWQRRR